MKILLATVAVVMIMVMVPLENGRMVMVMVMVMVGGRWRLYRRIETVLTRRSLELPLP